MANFAVLAQIHIDLARFKPKSYLTSDLDAESPIHDNIAILSR
jgi:hypothetical protein